MKPYLPILTAVIGVAIGWLVKPDSEKPAPIVKEQTPPKREAPAPKPAAPEPTPPAASFVDRPSTRPSNPLSRAAAEASGATAQSRNDAKMLRLTEALNLSKEQQAAVLKIIADAENAGVAATNTATNPQETLAAAATIGEQIEKSLNAILTPEQAKAFQDLQKRTQQNRLEAAAQKQLATYAPDMDLTPEQRAKALERVRESLEDKQSSRSSGISLMLDNSVLPVGAGSISSRSIESLESLAKNPDNGTSENQQAHIENQRNELDRQLELYKDILTPAQQAQLKLVIDERKSTLDRVNELLQR